MTDARLASRIALSDVDYERSYYTYTTPTYIERNILDRDQFDVKGGEKKSELQGVVVKGVLTSPFKHTRVRAQVRIYFDTNDFKANDNGVLYEYYPKKSFNDTVANIEIEPGERVYFQRYFDTKVRGEFKGVVLNILNVVPVQAGDINIKTLKVVIESVDVIGGQP